MRILFLDDDATRVSEFVERVGPIVSVTHVVTREDFCKALKTRRFDLIMLDHDLGLDERDRWNGTEAAKLLRANRSLVGDDQQVLIHSANPVGVVNMMAQMMMSDHLHVNVVWFAWAKARMIDGQLHFVV